MLLLRFPHQFDRKNVNRFEQFWVGISLKTSELIKLSLIVIERIGYCRWDYFFWNPWLISFLEPPSILCPSITPNYSKKRTSKTIEGYCLRRVFKPTNSLTGSSLKGIFFRKVKNFFNSKIFLKSFL